MLHRVFGIRILVGWCVGGVAYSRDTPPFWAKAGIKASNVVACFAACSLKHQDGLGFRPGSNLGINRVPFLVERGP